MYSKRISYFKFLIKSTNQHGIHSPFIFDYLTQCLYVKPKLSKDKITNVLLKSISYFHVKHTVIKGNDTLKNKMPEDIVDASAKNSSVDLLYFESMSDIDPKTSFSLFSLHNDSLIIIKGIYNTKESLSCWTQLINQSDITVSIDFFHCGLLFYRKEQVKQHFTIRI